MAPVLRFATVASLPQRTFAKICGSREFSAIVTTLDEFPGLPDTTPVPATAGSTTSTTLPSGMTVVTSSAASSSTVSLTFPRGGSSSESFDESGAALANQCMSFKSGSGLSSALVNRNLENRGAIPFTSADRYGSTIGFTTCPENASYLLPLLALETTFEKWDVNDALKTANIRVEEANSNAQTVLSESVYAASFGAQSPMGRPFYSNDANGHTLRSFRERSFVLDGAVLAATSVSNHDAFASAVEESFSEYSNIGLSKTKGEEEEKRDSPPFVGGECRIHAPSSGHSHIALAIPAQCSGPILDVSKHYLNLIASSPSSPSPFTAFTTPGLIGAYGFSRDTSDSVAIVDSICHALEAAMANPDPAILDRARLLAAAAAAFNEEAVSGRKLAEIITRDILDATAGKVLEKSDVTSLYSAITSDDVAAVFSTLSERPPALAAVGDISYVPYQGSIASRFTS